jgi:hypothetical protein
MLTAGWHAHTLNAPGKFIISAPGHDSPRRARAYLLTDDLVSDTVSQHATRRPRWTRFPARPSATHQPDLVGEDQQVLYRHGFSRL